MKRDAGIKQINETPWVKDEHRTLHLYATTPEDWPVDAWLIMRPHYCDRGHIQLNIDGPMDLNGADRFPRYFFSFAEADAHARMFLKWRLWKERTITGNEVLSAFEGESAIA